MTVSPVQSRVAATPTRRTQLALELLRLMPRLRRRLTSAMAGQLEEEFGAATPHQMEALHLLHLASSGCEGAGGATMNELARRQGCALSTATALVDRLLRHGLAERVADVNDRRIVRIMPTEKGEELLAQFGQLKRDIALSALEDLDDDEVATLVRLLRVVAGSDDQPAGLEEVTR